MPEIVEYSYDDPTDHLTEREAIEQYSALRETSSDALVVLRDLDCGHWQLKTYTTTEEKNGFLRRRLESMLKVFWSAVKLPARP